MVKIHSLSTFGAAMAAQLATMSSLANNCIAGALPLDSLGPWTLARVSAQGVKSDLSLGRKPAIPTSNYAANSGLLEYNSMGYDLLNDCSDVLKPLRALVDFATEQGDPNTLVTWQRLRATRKLGARVSFTSCYVCMVSALICGPEQSVTFIS